MKARYAMKHAMKIPGAALLATALSFSLTLSGCRDKEPGTFLGSAVIEVETWQVAALAQGPLLDVLKNEGDAVKAGETLAWIDTLPYALQVSEARANLADLGEAAAAQADQARSIEADLKALDKEASRARALAGDGAATAQALDRAVAARDAARYRLEAARRSLQGATARQEAVRARIGLLQNQLARCRVVAPADGRVLTRYRNPGESVAPGQSVFELGRADSVRADFYVPQAELANLKLGDSVRIRIEAPEGARHVVAAIRFIASEAEFTPKNVQTRESRAELVFRVRAVAPAAGLLKRGLPVEIWR